MTPLFKQSVFGCAIRCSLFETGLEPPGYSHPSIYSFNRNTGEIVIATDFTALHGTAI